jgi:HAD superfamily hydrolase (TIGR01509 family)
MGYTLLFDCDGVLAETERFGHLVAFNQMFTEFALPVHWSDEEYGERLKIGGGKERMASLLTADFIQKAHLPTRAEDQRQKILEWHKRKTAIYVERVKAGLIPARPGIARMTREALAAGWKLAVCSTSAEESVRAILEHVVGKEHAAHFTLLTGDIVPHKKPAPDIYQLALEVLNVRPEQTIAIEDSCNGLLAAVGAGIRCIITLSTYTQHEDMHEATMVLSDLGDPEKAMRIITNRGRARPGPYLTLKDLAACLGIEKFY